MDHGGQYHSDQDLLKATTAVLTSILAMKSNKADHREAARVEMNGNDGAKAATAVQRVWRGNMAREQVSAITRAEQVTGAVGLIQRWARGEAGRSCAEQMRLRK